MKEPTIRSLGFDEQKGFALGPFDELQRSVAVSRVEVAAAALEQLWQDLGLGPDAPLIFLGFKYHLKADHHQPRLLDMAVARGQRRKRARFGQLERWQRLEAPPYAYGIAQPPVSGSLLRANLLHEASIYDRKTLPGVLSVWTVLSVMFTLDEDGDAQTVIAYALRQAAVSRLPTLILVEDFELFVSDAEDPQRVLNTLDGVETPDNPMGTLMLATSNALEKIDPCIKDRPGRIDLLIKVGLVEQEDLVVRFLQRCLGAAYREEEHAPLAPTFLKQTDSYMRKVCLLGSIHALDQGRADISREDLRWAHETLLHGRALSAEARRFEPPPARKRGPFFGNKDK